MDQRSDEKLAEEQKRNREMVQRMDREKQLELENYSIRLNFFLRKKWLLRSIQNYIRTFNITN
jgi:hypothetical protein